MLKKLRNSKLNVLGKQNYKQLYLVQNQFISKHKNLHQCFNLEHKVINALDIPHQNNCYDCGVLLLEFYEIHYADKTFHLSILRVMT